MIVSCKLLDRPEIGNLSAPESNSLREELYQKFRAANPGEEETFKLRNSFLCANLAGLFNGFNEKWITLLHSFQLSQAIFDVKGFALFPGNLSRIIPISVGGEQAVLGTDEASEDFLASLFLNSPSMQSVGGEEASGANTSSGKDLLLEYFERRLVSTLNSSWQGEDSYIISYTEIFRDAGVEVQGAVRLSLEKDSKSFEIWFGLGPEAISAISELWRDELKKKWLSEKGSIPKVDTSVSASLGFLSIKPSELIDYTRSGALISLDLEELSQVHLLSDSKPWGSGSLVRGKSGRYLEVKSFQSAESNLGPHETLVSLEISKIELSPGEMLEGSQEGAVLTLNDYANSDLLGEDESVDRETLRVSLVVGGEELAIGDLLMLDGKPTVLIS